MLQSRNVDTEEMRKPELVEKLCAKYKEEGILKDDNTPIHGDKIEVTWDDEGENQEYLACTVYNGEAEDTLVAECHSDGQTYDFDPLMVAGVGRRHPPRRSR